MTSESELLTQWNTARTAWPSVDLPFEVFADFVRAKRITSSEEDHAALRTSDLYLACACAHGDEGAMAALEQAFFGEIAAAASRLGKRAPSADDLRQLVRERLFSGERPRIAGYSGRGDLKAWLRVVAVRTALNATSRNRKELSFEEHAFSFLAGDDDPELEYMKQLYRTEFVAAFGEAARALDDEDRALLRQAFLERDTVDVIGEELGVHRATAARWVKRAHERLVKGVHEAFKRRIALDGREYESVLRLIRSRLELSMDRLVAQEETKGG